MRGMALALSLSLVLSSVAARADESANEEVLPNPSKKWGYGFLGAAVPLLAVGIGLGAAAASRSSEQNGDVTNPQVYTHDLDNRAKEGQSLSIAAYCFLGIGAALAVVDVIVWFEVLRKPRKIKKNAMSISPSGFVVRF